MPGTFASRVGRADPEALRLLIARIVSTGAAGVEPEAPHDATSTAPRAPRSANHVPAGRTVDRIGAALLRIRDRLFPGTTGEDIVQGEEARQLATEICPQNKARSIVLGFFVEFAPQHLDRKAHLQVAVVGGYEDEPELVALRRLGYDVSVERLGIEPLMKFLDLNEPSTNPGVFDLVLCSQVWEHIWNHGRAFDTLIALTRTDGFLWLACPASNRSHGAPDYYSPGFTASYLGRNLRHRGMEIMSSGQCGSARCYRALHTLPTWLSVRGHAFPPLFAFDDRPLPRRVILTLRFFVPALGLMKHSPTFKRDSKFATESWVVARKTGRGGLINR